MGDPKLASIHIDRDYKRAYNRVQHYDDRIRSIATTKSRCFAAAQSEFDKFLTLKSKQDSIAQMTGIILLAAGLVLPEVGLAVALAKGLVKAENAARKLEMIATNAEWAQKKLEPVAKLREVNELAKSKKEGKEADEQVEKAIGVLEVAMKVIQEDDSLQEKTDALLDFVRDRLLDYDSYYLAFPTKYTGDALYNLVEDILSATEIHLSGEEIEQITNSYLHELLRRYCLRFRPFTFTHVEGYASGTYTIDLTDTQQEWIQTKFGLSVPRGKYFIGKYIIDLETTFFNWGVAPIEKVTPGVLHYGHNV
jgi:hypothetical protein